MALTVIGVWTSPLVYISMFVWDLRELVFFC